MALNGPIIIVEDDEDDQDLFRYSIEDLKIDNELRFFFNGREALTYLETTKEQPFLILCDVNMPIMNGFELRRIINNTLYLKRKAIPFVFFTTAVSPELVTEAYDLSVQGFFQKANKFQKLQEEVKLILDYWRDCFHPNSF